MTNPVYIKDKICNFNNKILVNGDKSLSIRWALIASQAIGRSRAYNLLYSKDIKSTLDCLKKLGIKSGISIKPETNENEIEELLEFCDLILIMTVNPGFGAQKFIKSQLKKITSLRKKITNLGLDIDIEVDGGINEDTSKLCIDAGANVLVAGSSIFNKKTHQYSNIISKLRNNF